MTILCLFISHLSVQWELRKKPELAQSALVIGGFPHERKPVIDCSEKASALGIDPAMTLRQASHRCPDAIFLPVDEAGYAQAFDEVLDILDLFSPTVETASLDRALLDISGTEQLFGPTENLAGQVSSEVLRQTGFKSQIGIASGKFVAGLAASLASTSPLIVRNSEEKEFLGTLSVDMLPISPESITWLKRLGLRTMGQVADLPTNTLDSQLGREGLVAHRLVNGIDKTPIIPRLRPDVLEETLSFEQPLESLGALLAALGGALDRLVPLMRKRYQVCPQIRLQFRCDDGKAWPDIVNLKTQSDAKPEMLGILKRHLEARPFPGQICEVYLGLTKLCSEFGRQVPLSTAARGRQQESLQRLERGLEDRFGHNPLKRVVELDSDCRIPERRIALIDFNAD